MQGQQNHSVPVRTGYTLLSPPARPLVQSLPPKKKRPPIALIVGCVALVFFALVGTCGWVLIRPMFTFREMVQGAFDECGLNGTDATCREAIRLDESLGDVASLRAIFSGVERQRGAVQSIKFGKHCSNYSPGFGRVEVAVTYERGVAELAFVFVRKDGSWMLQWMGAAEDGPDGCS